MATSRVQSKRSYEEEEEEDGDEDTLEYTEDEKKNKRGIMTRRGSSSGGSSNLPSCQADHCTADMTDAKKYHKRHKVCEVHAKAPVVLVAGIHQRFCQQCSRFHHLSEFDDSKRSCRRRLAGHNERRRKSAMDNQGEASN